MKMEKRGKYLNENATIKTREMQLIRIEIDMITVEVTNARRRINILDGITLLDKGICISNLYKFLWI